MNWWTVLADFAPAAATDHLLEKGLMIAGGAALGGLGTGLVAQALGKLLSGQKVPRWLLQFVRLLGAVVAGWLVAFNLSGTGRFGFGGGGGDGSGGPGDGKQENNRPANTGAERPTTTGRSPEDRDSVTVEVLTRAEVVARLGEKAAQENRVFHVRGEKADELRNSDELIEYLDGRKKRQPEFKVLTLVSKDPPSGVSGAGSALDKWAKGHEVLLKTSSP